VCCLPKRLAYLGTCNVAKARIQCTPAAKECVAQPRVVGEPRRVDWVRRFGVIGVRNVLLMQWIEELRNAVWKRDHCL
jgi:hypothetical protein